jgi:hypothetical protein
MTQSAPSATQSALRKLAEQQGFLRPTRIAPSPPVMPPANRELTLTESAEQRRKEQRSSSAQIEIKREKCVPREQQEETKENSGREDETESIGAPPPSPNAGIFNIDI